MGMRDWFRGKAAAQPPAPPATPPREGSADRRRFHRDRGRMFDIAKTHDLAALLKVPREARDDGWSDRFFDAVWCGSIALAEPQTFFGPDRLPYLRLDIPWPDSAFESQCLANLAGGCLDHGVGSALFASPDDPPEAAQYVFSPGLLDSLLRYDSPLGDPIDVTEAALPPDEGTFSVERDGASHTMTVQTGHQALVGTPSAEYLPPHLARALHDFLSRAWGIGTPRVQLLVDTHMRPHRSLVVNCRRSDFAPGADVDSAVRQLLWFLNPGRTVMLMPDHWSPDDMTPLTALFEGR
jgi:hypothetical protein